VEKKKKTLRKGGEGQVKCLPDRKNLHGGELRESFVSLAAQVKQKTRGEGHEFIELVGKGR